MCAFFSAIYTGHLIIYTGEQSLLEVVPHCPDSHTQKEVHSHYAGSESWTSLGHLKVKGLVQKPKQVKTTVVSFSIACPVHIQPRESNSQISDQWCKSFTTQLPRTPKKLKSTWSTLVVPSELKAH